MAATTTASIIEVRVNGSDTLNGGYFEIGAVNTNGLTDGAATLANTASPVFTSVSYNFVAGDVGAWLFIYSGTNWTPGWYQIASVASNAATLSAAVGAAQLLQIGTSYMALPSTAAGCATTASPTAAKWSIDYTQQATAQFSYTDITAAGIGAAITSASHPFGKQQIGNGIQVTSGTNLVAGVYTIASVSGTTATLNSRAATTAVATGASSNGVGGMGGAFATATQSVATSFMTVYIRSGTYSLATGWTINIGSSSRTIGYSTVRGDNPLGSGRPVLQATAGSITILSNGVNIAWLCSNLIFDGNSQATVTGMSTGNSRNTVLSCKAINCVTGFSLNANTSVVNSEAYNCTTNGFSGAGYYYGCYVNGPSTATANFNNFQTCVNCISVGGNLGFNSTNAGMLLVDCIAYGATSHGYNMGSIFSMINSIASNNGGYGINNGSGANNVCFAAGYASYSNTSGPVNGINLSGTSPSANPLITLSATPFNNAAGGDFSLNNNAGGGAALRMIAWPSTAPNISTLNYGDIGAVQARNGVPSAAGWA